MNLLTRYLHIFGGSLCVTGGGLAISWPVGLIAIGAMLLLAVVMNDLLARPSTVVLAGRAP